MTLVEILVVLALIGVMAGAVALSFGGAGRSNSALNEADLLVARLNRAADEIVLTATPMRFEWRDDGYQFQVASDAQNWVQHPVRILGEDHILPDGLRLQSEQNTGAIIVDPSLIPTPREMLTLGLSSDDGGAIGITFDGVTAAVLEPAT